LCEAPVQRPRSIVEIGKPVQTSRAVVYDELARSIADVIALADADVPRVNSLRPPANSTPSSRR